MATLCAFERAGTPEEVMPGVVERGRRVLEQTERLAQRLLRLGPEPESFAPEFKSDLQALITDLGRLAKEGEGILPGSSAEESADLADLLGPLLDGWKSVNDAIERAVLLAVKGQLDKRFLLLSPIANCANLSERLRLQRLRSRFPRASPPAASLGTAPVQPRTTPSGRLQVIDRDFVSPPPPPATPRPPAGADPDETLPIFDLVTEATTRGAAPALRSPEELAEEKEFEGCLARLRQGDEIESADAVCDVIRRFQHVLLARLLRGGLRRDQEIAPLLATLWRHADVLLLEDYFFSARRLKLVNLLAAAEPDPGARLFAKLIALFRLPEEGHPSPEEALAPFEREHPAETKALLRASVIHPLAVFRRHAIVRLSPDELWSVASFPHAPLFALADILDRLAAPDVSNDHRKIFFDCTFRTLGAARNEGLVRAARRMLSRFFAFAFFIEDDYFGKILRVNEAIEREEKRLQIESPFFKRSLESFQREKERAGSRKTQLPHSFALIPLTVQRKLARDGHYLSLFVRHPHPKVALETVRYITTPALAEQVLRIRVANPRVIAEVAKKEDLLTSYSARLALLAHPHTPLALGQKFIPLMRAEDLHKLAASRDLSPEIAAHLLQAVLSPER